MGCYDLPQARLTVLLGSVGEVLTQSQETGEDHGRLIVSLFQSPTQEPTGSGTLLGGNSKIHSIYDLIKEAAATLPE